MNNNKNDFSIRFSPLHLIGVLLLIFGLFCICFFGAESTKPTKKISISETEIHEEPEQDYNRIPQKTSEKFFMVVVGGFLTIAAVPFFYMPYAQHCITIKFRRSKHENEDLQDTESDYPDEDFDYILDEEMRKILIELRDENIRKKKNKLR